MDNKDRAQCKIYLASFPDDYLGPVAGIGLIGLI